MSDKESKKAPPPESVRLNPDDTKWLDEWTETSGQDRSAVLRAGVRLLTLTVGTLDFARQVKLIAKLARSNEVALENADLVSLWDSFEWVGKRLEKSTREWTEKGEGGTPKRGKDHVEAGRIVHGAAQDEKQAKKGTARKAGGAK